LNTQKDYFKVQTSKVNKQSETTDCGVFAAAYCSALAFGENPSAVIYDQKRLRCHLLNCLETRRYIFSYYSAKTSSINMGHCKCLLYNYVEGLIPER